MKYLGMPLLAGLSAGLVASLAATSAQAFERSKTPSGVGVSWAKRSITFHINERGSTDVDFDAVEDTVNNSFAVWTEPDCTDIRFNYGGTTASSSVGFNQSGSNQNLVVFKESNWPHQDGVIGVTTVTFCTQRGGICTYNGVILDADIEMNGEEFTFATNGSRRLFDLGNTLTHEVGHLLGLDHTPERNATMFASAPAGETIKRSLHEDDVDGVCFVYPFGASTPGGGGGGGSSSDEDEDDGYLCSAAPGGGAPGLGALAFLALLGLSRRGRGFSARTTRW